MLLKGFPIPFRTGSFICTCYWYETLLHFGPQAIRFLLEYLLLPPRSALKAVPHAVARIQLPNKTILTFTRPPTWQHLIVCVASRVSEINNSRHLSAIHFRGRFIRQVSCYTLLSGFRLPWPPSCCLYESTPFLGSAWVPPLGSLTRVRLVHPTSPVLLTRCGPLVTCNIKNTLWMLEKSVFYYHLKVWE